MKDLEKIIYKIISKPHLASLATMASAGVPWVRYVIAEGDSKLNIRFATVLDSRKVMQIKQFPHVHLTCGATSAKDSKDYLQIQGTAKVSIHKSEREAFWKKTLDIYFIGPNDPKYAVVIIKPTRIEYVKKRSTMVWTAPEEDPFLRL